MRLLVLISGRGNSIFLSIRPGRSKAGSRLSILLVARITFTSPLESKPSNWLSNSNIVLWISRSPPEWASYLWGQHIDQKHTIKTVIPLMFIHLPLRTNCINFINEDNWRWEIISYSEEFPHQFWTITQVFLNQFTTNNTQESCWCWVCHGLKTEEISLQAKTTLTKQLFKLSMEVQQ